MNNPVKKEFTEEEKKKIQEQLEVPKLRKEENLKYPNEATKYFYGLPLSDDQRDELYKYIMDIYEKEGPEAFKAKDKDEEENEEENKKSK